jgi:1-acyl-sn-glycerol-3-phosphate acyltransferase
MEPIDTETLQKDIESISAWFRPLEVLLRPKFVDIHHVPAERPLLFVGNHTIYGVLDVPFLYLELHRRLSVCLRPLGDRIHFRIPLWRDFLSKHGVVEGSRDACAQLFDEKQCVLVFPGGSREVAKRRGEKYQLKWGERLGFVRMAMAHGCTIVPFAALGADDAYDIVWDADDLMASPLGLVLSRLGVREDAILPLGRGLGGSVFPRPERLYFKFQKPVSLKGYKGHEGDDDLCRQVREDVAQRIESGIEDLQDYRASDPKRRLSERLKAAIGWVSG